MNRTNLVRIVIFLTHQFHLRPDVKVVFVNSQVPDEYEVVPDSPPIDPNNAYGMWQPSDDIVLTPIADTKSHVVARAGYSAKYKTLVIAPEDE